MAEPLPFQGLSLILNVVMRNLRDKLHHIALSELSANPAQRLLLARIDPSHGNTDSPG